MSAFLASAAALLALALVAAAGVGVVTIVAIAYDAARRAVLAVRLERRARRLSDSAEGC